MAVSGATYGTRYHGQMVGLDGFTYHLYLQRQSYSAVAPVLEVDLRRMVCTWTMDKRGSPLASLGSYGKASLEADVRDQRRGAFAETIGGAKGVWRVQVRRGGTSSTTGTLVYVGYLDASQYRDQPFEPEGTVTLKSDDGIGFMRARPFADPDESAAFATVVDTGWGDEPAERIAVSLGRMLSRLSGDMAGSASMLGMKTAVDLRPFIPSAVASTTDPLYALLTLEDGWQDADNATASELEAYHALHARFSARGFQSNGYWWTLERRLLCEDPAAVPVATYGITGASPDGVIDTSANATPASTDLTVDCTGWTVLRGGAFRAADEGAHEVESGYQFAPELDNLILNGSFERAGAGSGAEFWTLTDNDGTAARVQLSAEDATYSDGYALKLTGDNNTGGTPATATQASQIYFPGSGDALLRFSFNYWAYASDDDEDEGHWTLSVVDGSTTYALETFTITLVEDAVKGRRAVLQIEPLLDPVTNTAFVVGTRVLFKGQALRLWDGSAYVEAEMLEDAAVGDDQLAVSLDANLSSGDFGTVWYAYEGGTVDENEISPPASTLETGRKEIVISGLTPTGAVVSGSPSLGLTGPMDNDAATTDSYLMVDRMAFAPEFGGQAPTVLTHSAAKIGEAAGTVEGLPVALDAHRVGDGPMPFSDTRLVCQGADLAAYDTAQGTGTSGTGWTGGVHGGTSTEEPLDLYLAKTGMRQMGWPVQQWIGTLKIPNGQTLWPHNVPLLPSLTTLEAYAASGESFVLAYAPPPIGSSVTLDPGGANEETHTVKAVTRGVGRFTVHLGTPGGASTTLTNSHTATTGMAYSFYAWWKSLAWDFEGYIDLVADECTLDAETNFLENLTLGT